MSEGQGVKGHNQLDSTQEEARVRKEGGKVCLSCFCCSLSSSSSLGRETSDEWTPLDINIELDDEMNWGRGSPLNIQAFGGSPTLVLIAAGA